jgi:glycosyltransferase involved in cell wall biosynthesis
MADNQHKNVYINVTLFINTPLDSNFHGIIRTEVEFIKYIINHYPDKFQFFVHKDEISPRYIIVSELDIKNKLIQIENKSLNPNSFKKQVKQILYKVFPSQIIAKLNDIFNDNLTKKRAAHDANENSIDHTFMFESGSTIISLDPDFLHLDFMKDLEKLKEQLHLEIIMICYDLIPIIYPDSCVEIIRNNFPIWLNSLSKIADKIVCISQNTKDDLLKYFKEKQLNIPELDVVYLGDNSVSKTLHNNITPKIASLIMHRYIVYLASFEPRKNHQLIIDAYKLMLENEDKDIPKIYLVGTMGWKNKGIFSQIEENSKLKKYIKILKNINDTDLTALFQNCLFSIYPSLYEGWGLPIRESLMNGRFCISSNTSSLKEAGENYSEYIDPKDTKKWAERILFYSINSNEINKKNIFINQYFHPKVWDKFGEEVLKLSNSPL